MNQEKKSHFAQITIHGEEEPITIDYSPDIGKEIQALTRSEAERIFQQIPTDKKIDSILVDYRDGGIGLKFDEFKEKYLNHPLDTDKA